ncbi:glucose-1-phosphate adenylyltransferase [Pelagicoccus sp. SDUM812002]|uniref:glucose-1-phosphate adenylyltransferase n=1 Tax=Pelagicoccus sp. SDUM812002 TaxID=3041266 RepID=UPI00280C59DE|nr:glucose-1-phosphate adenylyltransferase [Pelagicoccus sp. SDUM812002]MDQ8185228.1 glucose-1-phosphate adenylyltransferase [Pelagicoccus sp. SDUM812002]
MQKKAIAVIMGGGRGSRLYPLTKERCKPAVPLAGKYRLVDIPISNCLNSGINNIYLLTQFNTASLHRHIQETYRFDPFAGGTVDILSAEQTEKGDSWYQGTADAVRQNIHHFTNSEYDYVIILSGDQLYRMDYDKIIAEHIKNDAEVTVAAIPFPADNCKGLGLMRVSASLEITEFVEKPTDPNVIEGLKIPENIAGTLKTGNAKECCLASMGIYVFNRKTMIDALDNSMTDFGKEVIPSLLGSSKLRASIFEGYWEDIGTVKAFFDANLQLADPMPQFNFFSRGRPIFTRARYLPASKINRCSINHVIIGDGCIITDSYLKRCVIGIRSVLREGTRLENVIMMGADEFESADDRRQNKELGRPDVGVGLNCEIKNAIIDKGARIGDNVKLNPEGKPDMFEKNGVFVRDGVVIVTKNTSVPSNTVF